MLPRFPAAFRPPAFASWASCPARGITPLSRSAYRATNGADPDRVSVFRTHEPAGMGAPYTPGDGVHATGPEVGGRRLPLHSGQPRHPGPRRPAPGEARD